MTDDILHLYAQAWWHGPAALVGTRGALEALRTHLEAVLDGGRGPCTTLQACTADGEGYLLDIRCVPAGTLAQHYALPYTDPVARERQPTPHWPMKESA